MPSDSIVQLVQTASRVFGWTYTIAWTVSFYPQPLLNWRRRSTNGSTIDYPFINTLGFLLLSTYTCLLYYSSKIRDEYAHRNLLAPEPTVRFNDVVFAVHAFVICVITLSMFSRSVWGFSQDKKPMNKAIWGASVGICFSCIAMAGWVVYGPNYGYRTYLWLDWTYTLGYCKMLITIIKYMPQAFTNYQRKSTVGWSIGQILLDLTGGIFSTAQLLIDSSLQGDWSGVTGNPVKFWIGQTSMVFDMVFMLQHYVLYRDKDDIGNSEEEGLLSDEARVHSD